MFRPLPSGPACTATVRQALVDIATASDASKRLINGNLLSNFDKLLRPSPCA